MKKISGIDNLDDYSSCHIDRPEDLHDLFVKNFYWGCDADDPMNAWVFNKRNNPFGAPIPALVGSDIGYFNVLTMVRGLPEAYELEEEGLMNEEHFRDFTYTSPVRFGEEANPNFFNDTVVEKDAATLSAKRSPKRQNSSASAV